MNQQARSALARFKVMAFVVGVGLLLLCLDMVLKYGFEDDVLDWWALVHGWLYVAYLVTVVQLGLRVRWSMGKMVVVMLAGVVPFFSFVMERKVAAELERSDADTLTR